MVASLFFPSTSSTPRQGSKKGKYLIQGHRNGLPKVFVQEVAALGGHFVTLCPEHDFYEAKKSFFIINFQKEKANTFTLVIILIVKSLQVELHSKNLLLH